VNNHRAPLRPLRLVDDVWHPFTEGGGVSPRNAHPSVHLRVRELREKLQAIVGEAAAIEAELLDLHIAGAVRDYADVWLIAAHAGATVEVLDALTKTSVSSISIPIDSAAWNTMLRRYTQVSLDIIEGAMMQSYARMFGDDVA